MSRLTAAVRRALFRERFVHDFLESLGPSPRILDVGRGNDSAIRYKRVRPDTFYVGLDIGEYNNSAASEIAADEFLIVKPGRFAEAIEGRPAEFDAVISSHNLEHCDQPGRVLQAMSNALRPGGRMYLAFPSEKSAKLPSRGDTLNFYDDDSHREIPVFSEVVAKLKTCGLHIMSSKAPYRPIRFVVKGLYNEPRSRRLNRTLEGTWALYGFESVIWATKPERLSG